MRRIAEHKRKIWKAMEHTIGMRIPLFLAFLILTLVPLLVQVRFTSVFLPEPRGRTDGGSAEPVSDFSKQDTQQ